MNEAAIYSLIGFFLLVLFFMLYGLWINKRLRRHSPPLFPDQPNLQNPVRPAEQQKNKAENTTGKTENKNNEENA